MKKNGEPSAFPRADYQGLAGKDGNTRERIYDVAVSGGRTIDAQGRARASVGNTVDVASAAR